MDGSRQKAREGKWNGGFAPYGYQLPDGKLIINEEEAEAIRIIYDQYVHTDIGTNGIAKYLENHSIRKIPWQNGKNSLFDAHLIHLKLRQHFSVKAKLAEETDSLDPDDQHYVRRKTDLDDRLYKMYDKIEDTESLLIAARVKKQAAEAEKLTGDNIYKVLIYFDKLYDAMNEQEQRQIMEALISEIQIYEERRPNGQWLKSIEFKLPIIEEDMNIDLDKKTSRECGVGTKERYL